MRCDDVREILSEYLDGALDPSVRQAVDSHLQSCRECKTELEDLQLVVDLVIGLPLLEPPADFRLKLRSGLESSMAGYGKRSRLARLATGRWSGVLAAAASVILVVGIAAYWFDGNPFTSPKTGQVIFKDTAAESARVEEKAALESPAGLLKANQAPQIMPGSTEKPESGGPESRNITIEKAGNAELTEEEAARKAAAPLGMGGNVMPLENGGLSREAYQAGKRTAPEGIEQPMAGIAAAPQNDAPDKGQPVVFDMYVKDLRVAVRELTLIAARYGGSTRAVSDSEGREIVLSFSAGKYENALADLAGVGEVAGGLPLTVLKAGGTGGESATGDVYGLDAGASPESLPDQGYVVPGGDPGKIEIIIRLTQEK